MFTNAKYMASKKTHVLTGEGHEKIGLGAAKSYIHQ